MVQFFWVDNFMQNALELYGTVITRKDPGWRPDKPNITKHNIIAVVMQTEEVEFTNEDTERVVDLLYSTYENEYIEDFIARENELNTKEIKMLLGLFK